MAIELHKIINMLSVKLPVLATTSVLAKDCLATVGPGYFMEKTEGDSEDESVNI